MRVLLTANASYVPPRGGATRSNLAWLKNLAAAGHACRIIASALAGQAGERRQMRDEELDRDCVEREAPPGLRIFECSGVEVLAIAERARLVPALREQIAAFRPDWVLVSSEDLGHVLLAEAGRSAPGRVVYLAHTPQFFPFGPASWNPDPEATALIRRTAGIVAIGSHTAAYIAEHTGIEPVVIHPPIYGRPPYPNLAVFDRGLVTMINPCAVKGISIFLALADRFPSVEFGAVPGWGTTADDRHEIERRSNIAILPNYRDIEDLFRRTRVLLMPSLWYEGFGLSVLEAKLRGIPTISSDSGGLLEGNVGTGWTIPVRGIERFEPAFDERGMPKPVLPDNDVESWAAALERLLGDRALYESLSRESQQAACAFVESIRPGQLEEYLAALRPRDAAGPAPPHVEALSAERRELLLRRLRKAHQP